MSRETRTANTTKIKKKYWGDIYVRREGGAEKGVRKGRHSGEIHVELGVLEKREEGKLYKPERMRKKKALPS